MTRRPVVGQEVECIVDGPYTWKIVVWLYSDWLDDFGDFFLSINQRELIWGQALTFHDLLVSICLLIIATINKYCTTIFLKNLYISNGILTFLS